MAKPASKPNWTVGNPNFGTVTVEPTAQQKEDGWLIDQRPPREFMNWLFFNITEWITYFDENLDGLLLQLGNFDAVVGFGGTHADINDLMADPDIATLKNVLVTQAIAPAVVQIINQDGMDFTFKPQAGIVKNSSTVGLQITSERVRIKGGRFTGFNGVGEIAIEYAAGAKNCLVDDCSFFDNSDNIKDNSGVGKNNSIGGNVIDEVA